MTEKKETLKLTNNFYSRRKYKIKELLDMTTVVEYERLRNELPKMLKVDSSTFTKWINMDKASDRDIPYFKLRKIADELKIGAIEDIVN